MQCVVGLDSDEDVCLSSVSVVSYPVVASCDAAWCVEERCLSGRREESDLHFSDHCDQCTQSSDNFFSNVSVNVERKAQPKMAAGSWQ